MTQHRRTDAARTHILFTLIDDEGYEVEVKLPCTWEVCPRCGGKGTHVNPSIDSHGITMDEWHNEWSPEEQDTYMSGGYDVPCYECKGDRVVPEVDKSRFSDEQKQLYRKLIEIEQELELDDMIAMSERRYGA